MDDLLRIARLQEAVDRQLKQYGTDQRGGGGSGSEGDKGSKGADDGRRNTGSGRGDSRGRRGRGLRGSEETNLVADRNHSQEPTKPVQQSPKIEFTVEQLTGHEQK